VLLNYWHESDLEVSSSVLLEVCMAVPVDGECSYGNGLLRHRTSEKEDRALFAALSGSRDEWVVTINSVVAKFERATQDYRLEQAENNAALPPTPPRSPQTSPKLTCFSAMWTGMTARPSTPCVSGDGRRAPWTNPPPTTTTATVGSSLPPPRTRACGSGTSWRGRAWRSSPDTGGTARRVSPWTSTRGGRSLQWLDIKNKHNHML